VIASPNVEELNESAATSTNITHDMIVNDEKYIENAKNVSVNIDQSVSPNIEVMVKGMVCSFCAQGIKKTFLEHDSIQQVSVSLTEKKVDLEVKPNHTISNEEIEEIVNASGYNIKEIKR
jgi:Cation transport ATPase